MATIRAQTDALAQLTLQVGKSQVRPTTTVAQPEPDPAPEPQPAQSAVATTPAQKRVALVIGNSAYRHATELPNPRNDAKAMSATLRSLGFEVVEGEDLSKAGMDEKVQDFADKVNDADVALFFYAGHGMQVAGRNFYLVWSTPRLERATSVDFETVDADRGARLHVRRQAGRHSAARCLPGQSPWRELSPAASARRARRRSAAGSPFPPHPAAGC